MFLEVKFTENIRFFHDGKIIITGDLLVSKGKYLWEVRTENGELISVFRYDPSKWFGKRYLITYGNGDFLMTFHWRRPHYTFSFGKEDYLLVVHKGRRLSLFRGKEQIAAADEPFITTGLSGKLYLHLDDTIDPGLIATVFYAHLHDDFPEGGLTFDFGNIGPELMRFDASWKPKSRAV